MGRRLHRDFDKPLTDRENNAVYERGMGIFARVMLRLRLGTIINKLFSNEDKAKANIRAHDRLKRRLRDKSSRN